MQRHLRSLLIMKRQQNSILIASAHARCSRIVTRFNFGLIVGLRIIMATQLWFLCLIHMESIVVITLDHFRLFQMFYAVYKKNKIQMNDDTIRKRLRVYVPIVREKCSLVPEHIHPHLFRHSRAMHLYL